MRDLKIHEAKELCKKYGRNTTLGDLVREIQGDKIQKCPKCNGTGRIEKEGLRIKQNGNDIYIDAASYDCDACHGNGYLKNEPSLRKNEDDIWTPDCPVCGKKMELRK